MPREGSAQSDNPIAAGETIVHGAGDKNPNQPEHTKDKVAPMPEPEKGAGLEGLPASGGGSQGIKQGPDVGQGGRGSSN